MAIKKYIGPNRLSEIFSYIKAELDKKVNAVSGKGLSTNDYTTTEKNKLAGISSGAEVNVQADWDESNTSSDAYILHKPTSMPASDVPSWAKQPNKPSYTFSEITSKPTTIAGYGITDAKIANGTITLGSNTITPLTQHQDISGKADKATTLAGYGITDAKIANGTITLGSNSITPLTQHQSVTNKGATLAWSTAVTVATIGSTDIKVSLPANPNTNTTYTFAGGTNKFTVTPSGGTAQDITITPSIANNITGSGTSGYLAKFNGANTITNGPQLGSSTTTYLRNDGSWATPPDNNTTYTIATGDSNGQIKVTPSSGSAYNVSVKGLGSNAYSSTAYLPLAGGTVTGKINRDAGGSWIHARNNALIMTTRTSGQGADWHPAVAIKTSSGCWSFGSVGGESLSLSYDTDADYSAGSNTSKVINFPTAGKTGTIALTSDIPTTVSQLTNDSGYITSSGSCASATKATQDGDGNVITSTYSTKSETTIYKGNLSSTLGSGTPAAATKTYWESNSNIPINTVNTAYNTNGTEYTLILSKGGSYSYGSVLKYGYNDRYLYILRRNGGTWQSTDWEKMYAGYADSAGSATSASEAAGVKQTATTVNTYTHYEVLLSGTNDNTTRTEQTRKTNRLTFDPYMAMLTIGESSSSSGNGMTGRIYFRQMSGTAQWSISPEAGGQDGVTYSISLPLESGTLATREWYRNTGVSKLAVSGTTTTAFCSVYGGARHIFIKNTTTTAINQSYGNWYYISLSIPIPSALKFDYTKGYVVSVNILSGSGLHTASVYGLSNTAVNIFLSSAKTESSKTYTILIHLICLNSTEDF